jgi:predicted O-methyltransferase YrrM
MNIEEIVLNGQGDTDRHLLTLYALVLSLKAKRILELGVRNGATTAPLLFASRSINGLLTSVDIATHEFTIPLELAPHWKFHQMDAIEFLTSEVAAKAKYDIIYIDDWHDGNHVKKELELVEQLVTPNSLILLHDLMYFNTCPDYHSNFQKDGTEWGNGGPYKAVSDLDLTKWEYSTIPVGHGLTILRKKGKVLYL